MSPILNRALIMLTILSLGLIPPQPTRAMTNNTDSGDVTLTVASTFGTAFAAAIGVVAVNIGSSFINWIKQKESVQKIGAWFGNCCLSCCNTCRRPSVMERFMPKRSISKEMRDTLKAMVAHNLADHPDQNYLSLEEGIWGTLITHTPTTDSGSGQGLLLFYAAGKEEFVGQDTFAAESRLGASLGDTLANLLSQVMKRGSVELRLAIEHLEGQIIDGQIRVLANTRTGEKYPDGMYVVGVGIHSPRSGGSLSLAGRLVFIPDISALHPTMSADFRALFVKPAEVATPLEWYGMLPTRLSWLHKRPEDMLASTFRVPSARAAFEEQITEAELRRLLAARNLQLLPAGDEGDEADGDETPVMLSVSPLTDEEAALHEMAAVRREASRERGRLAHSSDEEEAEGDEEEGVASSLERGARAPLPTASSTLLHPRDVEVRLRHTSRQQLRRRHVPVEERWSALRAQVLGRHHTSRDSARSYSPPPEWAGSTEATALTGTPRGRPSSEHDEHDGSMV